MSTKIKGYMLSLKWNGKLIMGLETTGFKVKPEFEEILLKANQGVPTRDFISVEDDFSFGGKAYTRAVGEQASYEDFETLRSAASTGATLAFVYGQFTQGSKIVSGNGNITDWSEDANSKDTATFSGTISALKGTVTEGTYSV